MRVLWVGLCLLLSVAHTQTIKPNDILGPGFWTTFKTGGCKGTTRHWRPVKNVTRKCDVHDDHCMRDLPHGPFKEFMGASKGEALGHMQPMGNQGAKMTWMPEMDARKAFNATEFYSIYVREASTVSNRQTPPIFFVLTPSTHRRGPC